MSAVGKRLRVIASKGFLDAKDLQGTSPEAMSFANDQGVIWFNNKGYGVFIIDSTNLQNYFGNPSAENMEALANLLNSGVIPLIKAASYLVTPTEYIYHSDVPSIEFYAILSRNYHKFTLVIQEASWILQDNIEGAVPSSIINNLESEDSSAALSAAQGKALSDKIQNLGNVYRIKGTKDTFDEVLALTDAKVGDVWNVANGFTMGVTTDTGVVQTPFPDNTNVVCIADTSVESHDQSHWDPLGGSVNVEEISTYNPNQALLDIDVTMPNSHGGLGRKKVSEMKGMTFSEIFDAILFPDVQPSVSGPSASISFSGYSGTLKEVGAAAPQESNFRGGFSRGSTSYDGPRAGEQIVEQSWVYVNNNLSNRTFPEKVILGSISYRYHASYQAGPLVHTLQGNVASINPNPLPAGSVNSSAITVSGTYPYYCNGASASTSGQESSFPSTPQPDTKLPLVSWGTNTIGCKFASEATTGTRLIFQFPAAKTVTSVQFYNTVSGKWETFGSSNYTISDDANKTIQGNEVAYKKLTTVGNLQGALQLRFNLSNV